MKSLMISFVIVILSASSLARADLISIACGENRGAVSKSKPAEVLFDSDDVTMNTEAWSLVLSGKTVKARAKAVFREDDQHWIYVVTVMTKSGPSRQFVFKVLRGCQEEGDVGTVSIWSLNEDGRKRQATLPCVCSSD